MSGGLGRLDNLRSTLGREKPRTRRAEEDRPEERRTGEDLRGGAEEREESRARAGTRQKKGRGSGASRRARGAGGTTRITVDLAGPQHSFLKTFVARSGSDGMSVVRALLAELAEDEALAIRVTERLVEERLRRQAESGK